MRRRQQYRIFALALLGATLLLLFTVVPSSMHSARIVGMAGKAQNGSFLVQDVDRGGPAAAAGLRRGDLVVAIDGRSIAAWWDLAHTRLSEYLAQRRTWEGRAVEAVVLRDTGSERVHFTVRPLHPLELGAYYFPRIAVIVVMIVLTVFLLSSNPKDSTALVIAVCFFAFIWWMGFDRPNWPQFLSPLLMMYGPREFLARELMVTLGMQVAISAILHVMLVFPRVLPPRRFLRPVVVAVYALPIAVMLFMIGRYIPSGLLDHMSNVYDARLWHDSALLLLLVGLIFVNSRRARTRIQEEQGRLLLRTVVFVTVVHIALWNVPKLFTGEPLLPSYNWMLPIMLLIPIALTLSIANHELFGIRGLIRRRMRYLDAMAQRRRDALGRRDHTIRALTEEIGQLQQELEQYVAVDEPPDADSPAEDRLQQLEEEYPAVRDARRGNLLGRSPLWLQVFEDAVLASRGDIPVLVAGESGTGKTELARTINAMSNRPSTVYREISCAQFEHADPAFALGKLFGVGKGHGLPNVAQAGQTGILEECDGGTLFLDDFDRLPLNAQDLLLYPLEGKAFEPGIGSGPPRRASLKFILATNRDTDELVAEGELRADVLARMGARVFIPPLRDRPEDIPLLIEHLVRVIGDEFEHRIETVSPPAMKILRAHEYRRGNVRELYSELRTAIGKASLAHDPILRSEYLSEQLRGAVPGDASAERPARERHRGAATHPDGAGGSAPARAADPSRELEVLRRNGFHIRPSEHELGLSHKSKTLSNHLRGRCIQALRDHDWDLEVAARALAGSDDREVIARVRGKMTRFLQSIERSLAQGTEQRLFNNLPAAYHAALTAAIRRLARR